MYKLRYYQQEAVDAATAHLKGYSNPFVLILPTGSGKSIVVSELCHTHDEPILILQPSVEILEQNYSKLLSYGVTDISIYSASAKSKEISKYTYATIGSIYKKPELFTRFKKVLLDECHLFNPKNLGGMYNKFFTAIGVKSICGLTATPYRLVQKYFQINKDTYYTSSLQTINRIPPFFFKKFAYSISIKELMDKGYLCPLEYYFYKDFDTSELKINSTGADFDEASVQKFWTDKRLEKLAHIIVETDKMCKHNLIFCSSIRQATKCAEMMSLLGLSAEVVHSLSPNREDIIKRFREGKIKHLCNVGVLSIGFDFPALDCVTLARPTMSLGLLYQEVGRVLRIDPEDPKKIGKVIDITENIKKLGRIETIRMGKEEVYKDIVCTDVGQISGKPLFTFKIKDAEKLAAIEENFKPAK